MNAMNGLPCETCGGLPCQEGCGTIDRMECAHGVSLLVNCDQCDAAAERAAVAYAAECRANRAQLGIVS